MALTRDFKETVLQRVQRDAKYREAFAVVRVARGTRHKAQGTRYCVAEMCGEVPWTLYLGPCTVFYLVACSL